MEAGQSNRPHVVVVGGGFGGLTAAHALRRAHVRVTLVDKTNRHTFQPLLYQVAMAGLSPADIAQPIRAIVRGQQNVTVLMAEAVRIDLSSKRVHLRDGGPIDYDFLVLSCGAGTSYFGHDDWARVAPGLKSIEDAIDIRQRVLFAFELAEREPDPARRTDLLSFVVIGGGPTGVELAGALAELSRSVLVRDFRNVNAETAKVRLIEAGPRILPSFAEDLSRSAVEQLAELGVEVRVNTTATAIEADCVVLKDERIPCSVALWAAGVRAEPLTKTLGVPLDRGDRVEVRPDLSVPGHPHAFVLGDAASLKDKNGKPLPGVSPVAMQQGRAVAKSIQRILAGRETLPFEYFDKGSMATIGRSRAIAQIDRIHLTGVVAWLAWLFVHIFYLMGFKNRLIVFITWTWSYLTYRRGARLITAYAVAQSGPANGRPSSRTESNASPGTMTARAEAQ